MVSAPFATNNTVTKGTKLPKSRTVIRKLSFAPSEPRRLIFDYCGAISALPGAFFFGYSGAIFERMKSLSIVFSGAKYARFTPKNIVALKSLFRVVENGGFAD